jgi:hypothetical protein
VIRDSKAKGRADAANLAAQKNVSATHRPILGTTTFPNQRADSLRIRAPNGKVNFQKNSDFCRE